MKRGKLIIFSAPSGSGKSTLIRHLLQQGLPLRFSISATSRPPRGEEQDGREYYFLSPDEFRRRIAVHRVDFPARRAERKFFDMLFICQLNVIIMLQYLHAKKLRYH